MEHREPPRIGPGERRIDGVAEEIRTRFRLRTFDLSENRRQVDFRPRLARGACRVGGDRRPGLFGNVGRAKIGGLVDSSVHVSNSLSEDRTRKRTSPLVRGRCSKVSRRSALGSNEPDHVSILNFPPEDLAAVFKKYAWVNQVVRVAYGSGRIRVELQYRQPVAGCSFTKSRSSSLMKRGPFSRRKTSMRRY